MIEMRMTFASVNEAAAFFASCPTLAAPPAPVQTSTVALAAATQPVKPKAEKPAAPKVEAAPALSAPVAAEPSVAPTPAAASVDYATLQKAVFKLAGISRESAAGAAGEFGVKHFKDLESSRWAEALDAVNAKLESFSAAVA